MLMSFRLRPISRSARIIMQNLIPWLDGTLIQAAALCVQRHTGSGTSCRKIAIVRPDAEEQMCSLRLGVGLIAIALITCPLDLAVGADRAHNHSRRVRSSAVLQSIPQGAIRIPLTDIQQ